MKKILLVLALIVAAVLAGRFIFGGPEDTWICDKGSWVKHGNPAGPQPQKQCLLYFWGNGCPHCENVDAFLKSWDKKDGVVLDKKEVWYNKTNSALMQEYYQKCNIKPEEMGVPLLVAHDGKCLTGDTPIIEYLKSL